MLKRSVAAAASARQLQQPTEPPRALHSAVAVVVAADVGPAVEAPVPGTPAGQRRFAVGVDWHLWALRSGCCRPHRCTALAVCRRLAAVEVVGGVVGKVVHVRRLRGWVVHDSRCWIDAVGGPRGPSSRSWWTFGCGAGEENKSTLFS